MITATLPSPPDLVYAAEVSAGRVTVRWEPSPGAGPTYTVLPERLTAGGGWVALGWAVNKTAGTPGTLEVSGLYSGVTYRFRVSLAANLAAIITALLDLYLDKIEITYYSTCCIRRQLDANCLLYSSIA